MLVNLEWLNKGQTFPPKDKDIQCHLTPTCLLSLSFATLVLMVQRQLGRIYVQYRQISLRNLLTILI